MHTNMHACTRTHAHTHTHTHTHTQLIITYLQMLEMEQNTMLAQRSWDCMNDTLRTNVFVRFSPETIACSCIYLAARQLKVCVNHVTILSKVM